MMSFTADQIAERIRFSIAQRQLCPRTLLKETELVRWFGVSRARMPGRLTGGFRLMLAGLGDAGFLAGLMRDVISRRLPITAVFGDPDRLDCRRGEQEAIADLLGRRGLEGAAPPGQALGDALWLAE